MVNCCVIGCKSRSERKEANITFHRYSFVVLILSLLTPQANCISGWFVQKKHREAWHGIFDGYSQFVPWDDFTHHPGQLQGSWAVLTPLGPKVNGSVYEVPAPDQSPDWRLPERPHFPQKADDYRESGRYYRIQPTHIERWMRARGHEKPEMMLCYCATVYKRLTPLGMGAVLTYRNVLTTALTSDMVISKYRSRKTLENILGAWYNTDAWRYEYTNAALYMTPARVIYHTRWSAPEMVNRSHPIPCVFDLAMWTSTRRFYYDWYYWFGALYLGPRYKGYGYLTPLCGRWSNYKGTEWQPDYGWDLVFIVGCQMVMDVGRVPFPWFRYAIRFHSGAGKWNPCPKTDWEWFLCIEGYGPNLRFGAEPGAALHVVTPADSWRYKGLGGLNSFAMKLRSTHFVNYFTLLDRHPVLEWIYDSIKGVLKPDYLDFRFEALYNSAIRIRPKGGTWVGDYHAKPWEYRYTFVWLKYDSGHGFEAYYRPIWWRK